jgi:hypothetical protein
MPSSSELVFYKNGKFVDYFGREILLQSTSTNSGSVGLIGPTGSIGPTGTISFATRVFVKTEEQNLYSGGVCTFVSTPSISIGDEFVSCDEDGYFTFTSNGTYLININYNCSSVPPIYSKIEKESEGTITYEMQMANYPSSGSISGIISISFGDIIKWSITSAIGSNVSTFSIKDAKISFIKLSEDNTETLPEIIGSTGPVITPGFDFSINGDAIGNPIVYTFTSTRTTVPSDPGTVEYEYGDISISNILIQNTPSPTDSSYSDFRYWIAKSNGAPTLNSIFLAPIVSGDPPTYTLTKDSISFGFDKTAFPSPSINKTYDARIYIENTATSIKKYLPIIIKIVQ